MSVSKEKVNGFIHKYLLLLPIIFAIGVIPLIVRITYYNPQLSGYSWFSEETYVMDMFMYHKNQAMMVLDAILVIAFLYLAVKKQLRAQMAFIPLALYFILVVFSSIASVAPEQTWNGFYGMLESAYALFGYCMLCFYAFNVVRNEKQLKIVLYALMAGIFVMGLIAVSQFTGHDFYMSDFGKDLIFPAEYAGYKEGLTITMGVGRVYASLFNPNYVGVYSCLLVPFLLVLTFSEKRKKTKLFYSVLLALVLVCLIGAKSKTAVLIVAVCLVFAFVYFGKIYWKSMLPVFVAGAIVFIGLNVAQGENSALSDTIDRVTGTATTKTYELSDITLNDEDFIVTYNDQVLTVKYLRSEDDVFSIEIVDENGADVPVIMNEAQDGFYLEGTEYEGLEFIFGMDSSSNIGFAVKVGDNKFFIYHSQTDNTYYYTNYYGRATKLYSSETYESPFFKLMGGFSGRGYIWSKSIPILKETLIFGSGPDTYAFMFPQYDYVSLVQNGWGTQLITKPHSTYLQIGIQTGVLSLIAYLVLNIWYLLQSVKLYFNRNLETLTERCGAGIFVGVICFLIAGLLHDSTIGVSVIYWTLLGVGFACNYSTKRNMQKPVVQESDL